jgi:heme exporter protein D
MLDAFTTWWPNVAAFLQMGKHGFYVWASFGACAAALCLEWWLLRRQTRRLASSPVDEGADDPWQSFRRKHQDTSPSAGDATDDPEG